MFSSPASMYIRLFSYIYIYIYFLYNISEGMSNDSNIFISLSTKLLWAYWMGTKYNSMLITTRIFVSRICTREASFGLRGGEEGAYGN